MSLTEIKNTLTKCFVGSLKLQNDHYRITVSYCGDYKTARETGKIEQNCISVRCECLDNTIMICNINASVYINMNKSFIPDIYDACDWEKIEQQMANALKTVSELQTIINHYFCT